MIAFGVEGYYDRSVKNDTNLIEWHVMFVEGDGNHKEQYIELEYHVCTHQDYKKFKEPDVNSINLINHFKLRH